MKLFEILQESLNPDSALQTLRVSIDALSQNLKTSIAALEDALHWRDPGQALPAIRPTINWLNDNYYSGRHKGGYNIESALSTLKQRPQYNKLATAAMDSVVSMMMKDKKVSSLEQIYGLASNVCQILQNTKSQYNVDSSKRAMTLLLKFTDLYKQLKKIPMSDRGIYVNGGSESDISKPVDDSKVMKGVQNSQVDQIVNDVLSGLDQNVAHQIRQSISKSDNKLQALQMEMKKRGL
jgi:hypothetical protein